MPRDSAATRSNILVAAVNEFAEFGLAGARIDRIADVSGANKRSLYVYFGDKDSLFRAALHHAITQLTEAVPLTEDDLPGYAGRMFDYHLEHPQALRMSLWRHLERPDYGPDFGELYAGKVRAVKRSPTSEAPLPLAAVDTIVLVLGLATSWFTSPLDLLSADGRDPTSARRLAAHRAAVVEAARRIVDGFGTGPVDRPDDTSPPRQGARR